MILALALGTSACSGVVIEDWSQIAVPTKGIPPKWLAHQEAETRNMTVVGDGDLKVLHLVSVDDSWSISRDIKNRVDIDKTPILEWWWKVIALPKGGDSRDDATGDHAAKLCVVWPRFPEAVRSRIICYVWDTTAPTGTIVKRKASPTVTLVVARSGAADLGRWVRQQRNIYEDFARLYGAPADGPGVIAIAISSELTRSNAEAYVGSIAFCAGAGRRVAY